ncbi:hypothetical protein IWQ47_004045 [Aquimarina sp. EL_43]|uniref:hypothetical protein n=1 Tax=unclassified Aquimarina TaxID=2627091 RepID=UPI0018CA3219|nr:MULTISPECIES: hypothetical protein [unclassified Aquimarina]MBG6132154.1 hypothetical protein [Aquimarina sp. EL_35]MBG6152951.1 hypothetical protein [Aquimarina sp. EL_32]MBG6170958.1 hypothetical protein [Aquimarina sp. EL_43]
MNRTHELQEFYEADDQREFSKKLLSIVPHLHPYVKHRLYIAESVGILPQNMYCSNGIIDDAILKLYHDDLDVEIDTLSLELQLFKIADELIDELYIREGWHQKSISTSYFLKEELERLEENYTVEADNELIMKEELDDICYHQNSEEKQNFIYNDMDSDILKVIDSEPSPEYRKQKLLGKFYSWLPIETSKIIDLFVFGKLNFEEIAKIKEITAQEVKEIIIDVRKSFRRNLI